MIGRISNKQRIVLEDIEQSERVTVEGRKIPLYIENMPDEVQFSFNSESERARWLVAMERRGLITIEKGAFLRLAEGGLEALRSGPPATRRDFQAEELRRQKKAGLIRDDDTPKGWPFQ